MCRDWGGGGAFYLVRSRSTAKSSGDLKVFWSEANKLMKCVLGSQEYNSCEILPLGQGGTHSAKNMDRDVPGVSVLCERSQSLLYLSI